MAIIESTITTMIFRMIIIKLLPSIEEEQPQHQRHKRTVTINAFVKSGDCSGSIKSSSIVAIVLSIHKPPPFCVRIVGN